MNPASQKRPLGLRILNGVGKVLRTAGLPVLNLDADALMEQACRNTGISEFGAGPWQNGLRQIVDAFEDEAALTTLGRLIARRDLLRTLENRLRIVDTVKRNPAITERPIWRPLFILGLPRTGTTILHELLAQDPLNRVPMTWEVMHPWPPPELATYDTDPRIALVEKHFSGIDRVLPGFKAVHPMGALLPQECVALTQHDFATLIFHTTHDVPSYQRWLDRLDMVPVYESHKRQLQYLQWRCPTERWVLKSPGHLWSLDALLRVYPDARIVQTHRDPLKVVASLTSLITMLRSLASDRIDTRAIAVDWTMRLADGLQKTLDVRLAKALPSSQVFDVQFREFLGNELSIVRSLYDHFEMQLTEEAEQRMRRFLAVNPADKHGKHLYKLASTGLDEASERRRFAVYQDFFRVASEANV